MYTYIFAAVTWKLVYSAQLSNRNIWIISPRILFGDEYFSCVSSPFAGFNNNDRIIWFQFWKLNLWFYWIQSFVYMYLAIECTTGDLYVDVPTYYTCSSFYIILFIFCCPKILELWIFCSNLKYNVWKAEWYITSSCFQFWISITYQNDYSPVKLALIKGKIDG